MVRPDFGVKGYPEVLGFRGKGAQQRISEGGAIEWG